MTEIVRRATRLVPNRFQSLALVGAVLVSLCSVPNAKAEITFVIPPVRSGDYTLEGSIPAPVQIVVEDGRKEGARFADAKIGIGKLNLKLTESGTDPVTFLAESIASELTKHGIAASTKPSAGAAVIKLRVEQFYVDVRFASSFGPTTTLTRLRTVVTYNGESQLVSGAVVRSMVLKSTARKNKKGSWTYVFSDPVHMVIREAAAKLNRHYWSLSVPDSKTDQMIAAVPETLAPGTVTKLVDLSSTNNQRATKYFVGRVTHPDQTHRRAALWALGLLGSNAEVPLLEKTAMESDDGSLMMSLKSLGDIGTPEARAAMKKLEDAKRPTLSDRGIQWLDAVLSVYR